MIVEKKFKHSKSFYAGESDNCSTEIIESPNNIIFD